jgi:predicted anti-sigma-YlaC factor YlaD
MTCPAAEPLIARYADDPTTLSAAERQQLDAHLAVCEACRLVLDDQRHVARVLHARPQAAVPSDFATRLGARLDAESQDWLSIANWRAWTVAVAPIAAALMLVAWLGGVATTQPQAARSAATAETFETWAESAAPGDQAAVFLESSTGDLLLEAVLTGAPEPAGDSDAR